jgi:hypothetical protein
MTSTPKQAAESKPSHFEQLAATSSEHLQKRVVAVVSREKDVFVFQSHFFASPISLLNLSLVQQQELNAWTR